MAGWSSLLSALVALLVGLGVLAYFISPTEWVAAVRQVPPLNLLWSGLLFLMACLAVTERWRACLSYRAPFAQAFHSLGIAMAGNLLIPGRSGEPLRVYALYGRGLPVEVSTSGVVQERLADQIFRIVFLALALLIGGVGAKGDVNGRLLAIVLVTLSLFAAVGLLIRYRIGISRVSGAWLGRLPKLNASLVERFVHDTLVDLSSIWGRRGGPQSLLWGLLGWLLFATHTNFILSSFFPAESLVLSCVVMAFVTPTGVAKPGYYHAVVVASLYIFSADKTMALKAAVVLHLYQMVLYSMWGAVGWVVLTKGRVSDPGVSAAPP